MGYDRIRYDALEPLREVLTVTITEPISSITE
jgi:hypothetical protein